MSFKLLKIGRARVLTRCTGGMRAVASAFSRIAFVATAICVAVVPTRSQAVTTHYMPHAGLHDSSLLETALLDCIAFPNVKLAIPHLRRQAECAIMLFQCERTVGFGWAAGAVEM